MANVVLLGAQWGDEGKGKIVDVLTERAEWVVRYQGGSNAGHTVIIEGRKYVLHLTPSGILRPGKRCVIGNGLVVDPLDLVDEIEMLRGLGVDVDGRLFLSCRAHLVLPHHKALDSGREERASAGERLGTTRRGIGPAYVDKAARIGLRAGAMAGATGAADIREALRRGNEALRLHGLPPVDIGAAADRLIAAAEKLRPLIADTCRLLNEAAARGEPILFEGAQGTMLDLDFGTYPFVSSSNSTAGGAAIGTGVSPRLVDRVIGVIKAYTTRVGEGPFPTELKDATGELLRKTGGEYGATTGRPRRCGWFDVPLARYSAMVNGIEEWALTKLDVLNDLPVIRVAVAYRLGGKLVDSPLADARDYARCEPVYEEIPGWQCSTEGIERPEDLPPRLLAYVRRLEELTSVPVGLLSVGPDRRQTLDLLAAEGDRRF